MKVSRAIVMTFVWVTAALLYNAGIYYGQGPQKALEFLTGYVIELSLSVDNLFVFLLIFSYFRVPASQQSRILSWGILGAQLMRGIFIFAGLALLNRFHWLMYVLGAFLVFTGFKLFIEKSKKVAPQGNPVLNLAKHYFPGLSTFALVLIVIETTDLIFAVDSIPAILAISLDTFIVFTSNVFAILGLRALYFALCGMMDKFHLMHYGLGGILFFIGIKMVIHHFIDVPIVFTLSFIASVLTASIVASIVYPKKEGHEKK